MAPMDIIRGPRPAGFQRDTYPDEIAARRDRDIYQKQMPSDERGGRDCRFHVTSEQIPGWLYFDEKRIQGRIHGNTYWNIKGELNEKLPIGELLIDPLLFTLNHPTDFEGEFTGSIGRGQVLLKWGKSGATITGRSGQGDFQIAGKTYIDWSP